MLIDGLWILGKRFQRDTPIAQIVEETQSSVEIVIPKREQELTWVSVLQQQLDVRNQAQIHFNEEDEKFDHLLQQYEQGQPPPCTLSTTQ